MSFFQTEKGKITTGILAAVIATTAIMVPVTIVADRSIRGDENTSSLSQSIETYSYTATAGTTTNGFGLAGIGNGSNEETIEYLNKTNSHYHDVLTDPEIIDGVVSHDGLGFGNEGIIGSSWKGDDATTHALDIYDEAGTIITDTSYDTPLSINMKVSAPAADVLRGHMYGAGDATALTPEDMDEYGTEIVAHNDKTKQQFAVAFGFFNWVTYSKTAMDAEDEAGYLTDGLVGTATDPEIATWWTTTFETSTWGTESIDGTFQLAVDGSSTVNPAFDAAVVAFNGVSTQFDIMENLNNSGSSNSWGFDPSVVIPGTTGTTNGTASAYTFLGTSSSLQRKDDVLKAWGYTEGAAALQVKPASDEKEIADIETAVTTDGAVLETTIAVDGAPTFFTSADLRVTNPETGNQEQPIGITKEGIQAAYIYGASWESLAFQNELVFAVA